MRKASAIPWNLPLSASTGQPGSDPESRLQNRVCEQRALVQVLSLRSSNREQPLLRRAGGRQMRLPENRAGAQLLLPAFRAEPTNTRRQSVNHPSRQSCGAGPQSSFNHTALAELFPPLRAESVGRERRLSFPPQRPRPIAGTPSAWGTATRKSRLTLLPTIRERR